MKSANKSINPTKKAESIFVNCVCRLSKLLIISTSPVGFFGWLSQRWAYTWQGKKNDEKKNKFYQTHSIMGNRFLDSACVYHYLH